MFSETAVILTESNVKLLKDHLQEHKRQSTTMKFFVVFTALFGLSLACGDGWSLLPSEGQCYKLFTTPSTFLEANSTCKGERAYLAHFNSAQYNAFAQLISSRNEKTPATQMPWIGGQWNEGLKRWMWIAGLPFSYANWCADAQPGDRTKNCVQMSPDTGCWTNVDCEEKRPFVCGKWTHSIVEIPDFGASAEKMAFVVTEGKTKDVREDTIENCYSTMLINVQPSETAFFDYIAEQKLCRIYTEVKATAPASEGSHQLFFLSNKDSSKTAARLLRELCPTCTYEA
ncbi:hypothetical protein QR680_015938 [Steinernema hermaphroditum]|uniref:C-type lectin domain-containing protein n=1 Tax=Steinernema hermaphroditum TaxID=289476 RepID=A0AA39H9H2_9BILA|nr:hypothetical protein QR680_015938 [Steinernema hermaphroditum]